MNGSEGDIFGPSPPSSVPALFAVKQGASEALTTENLDPFVEGRMLMTLRCCD